MRVLATLSFPLLVAQAFSFFWKPLSRRAVKLCSIGDEDLAVDIGGPFLLCETLLTRCLPRLFDSKLARTLDKVEYHWFEEFNRGQRTAGTAIDSLDVRLVQSIINMDSIKLSLAKESEDRPGVFIRIQTVMNPLILADKLLRARKETHAGKSLILYGSSSSLRFLLLLMEKTSLSLLRSSLRTYIHWQRK